MRRSSFDHPVLCSILSALLLAVLLVPQAFAEIRFRDVTATSGDVASYHRERSPSDALLDAIKAMGIASLNDFAMGPLKSRGAPGVALFDADGDGDLDLYATNGPGAANSFFVNQLIETGNLEFDDRALSAGLAATAQDSTGVCYGDLDNDGDSDLYVLGNAEPNRLFENLGGGNFTEVVAAGGAGGGTFTSTSCSMGDVDGDGLTDIFVGNTMDMSSQLAIFVEPFALNQPNLLFRNLGGLGFEDVSDSSGIRQLDFPVAPPGAAGISWAVAMVDIDLDGDLDLVQADDQAGVFPVPLGGLNRGTLHLLENDGHGHFTDRAAELGLDRPGSWMGLAFADFNGDGRLDIFGTNLGNHSAALMIPFALIQLYSQDSRVFTQRADGTFADPLDSAPSTHSPFGWGAGAFDADLDGDSDLVYHGGIDFGPFFGLNPGVVLVNDGTGNLSRDAGAYAESLNHTRRLVHGMAVGDLDLDGRPDVVTVSNMDMPEPLPLAPSPPLGGEFQADAAFFPSFSPVDPVAGTFSWNGFDLPDGTLAVELNESPAGGGAAFDLLGTVGLTTGGRVSRDAFGAVARFRPDGAGHSVLVPVLGGSSYASQHSSTVHVGLGEARRGTLEVLWPGGARTRIDDVRPGERLTIPEIPCDLDAEVNPSEHASCVRGALDELVDAGVLSNAERARFLSNALRAFGQPPLD